MGVDTTNYIVFGYKLPYSVCGKDEDYDDFYEKFKEYIESEHDEKYKKRLLSIISDGMDGKYCIVGKIIDRTDADCYCFSNNFNVIPSPIIDNDLIDQLKSEFIRLFPKYSSHAFDPRYFVFTHCS